MAEFSWIKAASHMVLTREKPSTMVRWPRMYSHILSLYTGIIAEGVHNRLSAEDLPDGWE